MKKIILFLLFIFPLFVVAEDNVVNVYNWSGYIPPEVITQFEKETGIQVNYSTFDENETLYTKLKADPHAEYDIVVPSSDALDQMRKEGMLHVLDKSKLTHFKYLDPKLLNRSFDPNNQYSIPYLWGTTGIIINTKYYHQEKIRYWRDLWQPRFKNQIAMMNDVRDVFAVALMRLGYSVNDKNPSHIRQAYLLLKQLLPNIQSFTADGSQQMFINEDSNIGMIESGDANTIIEAGHHFHYIYPKDGVVVWMDNMAIPLHAPHIQNAYRFINFILRPDIAKKISVGVGFSSPNWKARQLMSKKDQDNRVLNPNPTDLKHAQFETYIGKKAEKIYYQYWERLKLGV